MKSSVKMTHPDAQGCIYVPESSVDNMNLKGWIVADDPPAKSASDGENMPTDSED